MNNQTVFEPPMQYIRLQDIFDDQRILDVGGGGEGLVARVAGSRVCVVDSNIDKIREARIHEEQANWFNCDGASLCFKDASFDLATLWFSLGYMRSWHVKEQVLKETYRVLRDDARLSIWAGRIDCDEQGFLLRTDIIFPDGTVSRFGFGVAGQQNQTLETVSKTLDSLGFHIERSWEEGYVFYIDSRKE